MTRKNNRVVSVYMIPFKSAIQSYHGWVEMWSKAFFERRVRAGFPYRYDDSLSVDLDNNLKKLDSPLSLSRGERNSLDWLVSKLNEVSFDSFSSVQSKRYNFLPLFFREKVSQQELVQFSFDISFESRPSYNINSSVRICRVSGNIPWYSKNKD